MVWIVFVLAAAVCLVLGGILYIRHELDCLETAYYTVESERLPKEFDGARFVLLSDLHNKSFGKENERLLSAIERQKPDFIVVAGDLVTRKQQGGNTEARKLMEKLGKQYDVFYGRGNHEEKMAEIDPGYEEDVKKAGVYYLNNQTLLLKRGEGKIRITGLSLPMKYFKKFRQTPLEPDTIERLIKKRKEGFNLLIAHKPAHFYEYAQWGADLVVSGHVHGGVIRFPFLGGLVSPQLEFFPKFDAGKFTLQDSTLIVSRGLGSHSIPVRIHNRPELVTVVLKRKKSAISL